MTKLGIRHRHVGTLFQTQASVFTLLVQNERPSQMCACVLRSAHATTPLIQYGRHYGAYFGGKSSVTDDFRIKIAEKLLNVRVHWFGRAQGRNLRHFVRFFIHNLQICGVFVAWVTRRYSLPCPMRACYTGPTLIYSANSAPTRVDNIYEITTFASFMQAISHHVTIKAHQNKAKQFIYLSMYIS